MSTSQRAMWEERHRGATPRDPEPSVFEMLPLMPHAIALDVASLARVRPTPPQTARDHAQRARNVRNAFAVRRPARVVGRRVLLVDDVMTTGATVDECARVLRAAGARRIDVLTLARVV